MNMGALGTNLPMIGNREGAEKAVRRIRYPPDGNRMWGPFHAPFRWGVSMRDYMATADDEMICMITIEHFEAVERIDEIMAVPRIDVAGIGARDLPPRIDQRRPPPHPERLGRTAPAPAALPKSGAPIRRL